MYTDSDEFRHVPTKSMYPIIMQVDIARGPLTSIDEFTFQKSGDATMSCTLFSVSLVC
jgi:hypothetical protein